MIAKFLFADLTINDLCVLVPRHWFEALAASVTQLFKHFTPTADLDAILMEFREYQSLPDPQLPAYKSLDDFWDSVGDLPKPAGEFGEKRFGNLTGFCTFCHILQLILSASSV